MLEGTYLISGYMLIFYFGMIFVAYAVTTGKGYNVAWGILTALLTALTSPILILLFLIFLLPAKPGSYWMK